MPGVALCGMCRCFHRFSFKLLFAQCEGRCPAGSSTNVPAPTRERRGATNAERCIIFLLQSSSSSKSAMLVMTTGSSLPTLLILFELCCFFAFRFLVGPSTFSLFSLCLFILVVITVVYMVVLFVVSDLVFGLFVGTCTFSLLLFVIHVAILFCVRASRFFVRIFSVVIVIDNPFVGYNSSYSLCFLCSCSWILYWCVAYLSSLS